MQVKQYCLVISNLVALGDLGVSKRTGQSLIAGFGKLLCSLSSAKAFSFCYLNSYSGCFSNLASNMNYL